MKRLAAVLPLVLIAACGGSDDDQVSSGLSKAQYLVKTEAICATLNKDVDALPRPLSGAALAAFVEGTLRIVEEATSEIKALEPPAGDKAELEAKVLDPLDLRLTAGKAYLVEVKAAAAKKDQAALGRLIVNPPASTADLTWMRSYGFRTCVEAAAKGS